MPAPQLSTLRFFIVFLRNHKQQTR